MSQYSRNNPDEPIRHDWFAGACRIKKKPSYRAVEYAYGHWHVIGPDGLPLYDDEPYGKDKPLIFRDEDEVIRYVEICNASML